MAFNLRQMAISQLIFIVILNFFLFYHQYSNAKTENLDPSLRSCQFDKMYQLGDSLADTGNFIRERPINALSVFVRPPYGRTFGRGTGRCSDGLLIIDYIALAAGLPYLNPYKQTNANFTNGVNFAVAGSTASPIEVLAANNISSPHTNSSLDVQLDWMASYFKSTSHTKQGCQKMLKKSLFLVGEIGGNDYNYAFFQGKSMVELRNLAPLVIQAITTAVRRVIHYGATRIIVPGNIPIGCLPIYLTGFQTNDSRAYGGKFHCLRHLNNFSIYHNNRLKHAIDELKKDYPNTTIVYGDYFGAFWWLQRHARNLGFYADSLHKACCGYGGLYNFDPVRICGIPGVPVCPNPNRYISWDGIHPTQQAYKYMTRYLIHKIKPHLRC